MNVGWMGAYQGLNGDTISGGGEHVKRRGFGHEIFNFKPFGGRYYGYGLAARDSIALERLGAPDGADSVDGVLVVWVARSYVVGWYKNARVYREWQSPPPGSGRIFRGEKIGYYVTARVKDCRLLGRCDRTLAVPRAWDVDGGMGRYVWYAEGERHAQFLRKLSELIADVKLASRKRNQKGRGRGAGWQLDPRRRKRIEEAAVLEVLRYYKELGYEIKDRQDEHCGWDLEAADGGGVLNLEVKGVAGSEIAVELSANEFRCMKKNRNSYRVCIVTNALSEKPRLSIYQYVAESRRWENHEDGSPIRVKSVWVQTARLYR